MKNTFKVLAIIAIAAVIGLSFASCGDDDSGSSSVTYDPVEYKSSKGDTTYSLKITKNEGKAAFTPSNGDFYTLTITTAGVTITSNGTISISGNTFTLTHTATGASFTVTISSGEMTSINGTIPTNNGESVPAPGVVTPEGGGGGDAITPATLASYLAGLSPNSISTPHNIPLKVSSESEFPIIKAALEGAPDKFVSLDLSGSTITEIPQEAFSTLLTSEPSFTFRACLTLTGIIIPNSVKNIGMNAFQNCSNLSNTNIPNSVISIELGAFSDCYSFTSINIPDSVTSLGYWAFYQCYNLTSVIIGSGITSIGNGAFENCTSLSFVTIPNSISKIENWAFSGSGLKSITIPDSVTSIGDYAFNTSNLTSVTFQGTIPSSDFSTDYAFKGDLRYQFYATNFINGTPGTYTRDSSSDAWTRQ